MERRRGRRRRLTITTTTTPTTTSNNLNNNLLNTKFSTRTRPTTLLHILFVLSMSILFCATRIVGDVGTEVNETKSQQDSSIITILSASLLIDSEISNFTSLNETSFLNETFSLNETDAIEEFSKKNYEKSFLITVPTPRSTILATSTTGSNVENDAVERRVDSNQSTIDLEKKRKCDLGNSSEVKERPKDLRTLTAADSERNKTDAGTMVLHLNVTSAIDATEIMSPIESIIGSKVSAAVQILNPKHKHLLNNNNNDKENNNNETSTSRLEVTRLLTVALADKEASLTMAAATRLPSSSLLLTKANSAKDKSNAESNKLKLSASINASEPTTSATFEFSTTASINTIPMPTTIKTSIKPETVSTTQTSPISELTTTTTTVSSNVERKYKDKDPLEIPIEITTMSDLREYKRELNQVLRRIEKEIFLREGYKTKQFTPITTSLPKKISSMFLQKISAALNVSPKSGDRSELDKRLMSLISLSPNSRSELEYSNAESFVLAAAATAASSANNRRFNPIRNHSVEQCKNLTQAELVRELKQRGTYNPDLMAWDVSGVLSFLDRSIADQYERQTKSQKSSEQAVRRNVEALERLLAELNLHCDVSTPEVIAKLSNLTLTEPRRSIMSPSIRLANEEIRYKRNVAKDLIHSFNSSRRRDNDNWSETKKQKLLGEIHVMPFGCDKRGEIEDGYLRLCGACQAIRKLPDSFFPPFINEVTCDEDKACMYFYDYPHGKCKQRHMNFVVLKNMGTEECQIWQKFNLNVRVSCECFVDEMSFFAKYV